MKKLLILAGICLVGILMASCTKDDPQNVLKVNNKSYNIDHAMAMTSAAEVHIDFDITSTGTHGFPRFSNSCVGKKVNLGKASGPDYSIGVNGDPQLYTMQEGGKLLYNDFKSGYFLLKEMKEGYRFTLDGELSTGEKVYIDLYAKIEERL